VHEIKHDGYRLLVRRTPAGVWIATRRGFDRTDRYPLIVDAAKRLRATSFVLDGEGVILRQDGVSDFDRLRSRRHDNEVQLLGFEGIPGLVEDQRTGRATSLPRWPERLDPAEILPSGGDRADDGAGRRRACTRRGSAVSTHSTGAEEDRGLPEIAAPGVDYRRRFQLTCRRRTPIFWPVPPEASAAEPACA